jgi:hypothetical protein
VGASNDDGFDSLLLRVVVCGRCAGGQDCRQNRSRQRVAMVILKWSSIPPARGARLKTAAAFVRRRP